MRDSIGSPSQVAAISPEATAAVRWRSTAASILRAAPSTEATGRSRRQTCCCPRPRGDRISGEASEYPVGGDRISGGNRISGGRHQNMRWRQNIGWRASEYQVATEYPVAHSFDLVRSHISHHLISNGQARFCRRCLQPCFASSANFCSFCGHHLSSLAVDATDGRNVRDTHPATPTSGTKNPVERATLVAQVFACMPMHHVLCNGGVFAYAQKILVHGIPSRVMFTEWRRLTLHFPHRLVAGAQ